MIRLRQRRGFTLVEMLVVMGIIVLLSAAAMLIVPSALNKDRSTDAVTSLRGWLEIAQARAARDGAPRGLRFIVDYTKPFPPTSASDERLWITEVQYIESPPVMVFNPNPPYPNGPLSPLTPRVEFLYELAPDPTPNPTPLKGTVLNRHCLIRGLDQSQANQVVAATASGHQPAIWLPVLGTWHRITAIAPAGIQQDPPLPAPATSYFLEVILDQYPDTQLGASTFYVTYHFGIYGPPRPLLGEPTMQLPTNTCVDLYNNSLVNPNDRVSTPGLAPLQAAPPDFDILFAPNGSVAFTPSINGESHIFLCVRDPRKGSPMNLFDPAQIRLGGEMMILAIKSRSGAIAVQPVDLAGDPYSFAKQSVSGQ